MKTTMTLGGIGPRLMLLCLPYALLSLTVMQRDPEFLNIKFLDTGYMKILGIIWLVSGVIFWISSAVIFLRNFKSGKLIKNGTFCLCRNPIYASIIIFIVPALAVIFHSGLLFSIAMVLYIGFRLSIHGEKILLKRTFEAEYEVYEKSVNEIVPFPRFLFKKQEEK